MPILSAGLLMCRFHDGELQFFLVHPGGPLYVKKNEGVWSIPKGIVEKGEDLLAAAQREFKEETGLDSSGPFHPIGQVRLKSGKEVHAWAFRGEWEESAGIVSNHFDFEWPPRSGKKIRIPEADRAAWMSRSDAASMIHPLQTPFLERAEKCFKTDFQ